MQKNVPPHSKILFSFTFYIFTLKQNIMVFAAAISFGGIFATSLADPVSCPANDINAFVCRDGTVCDHFTHPDGAGCCVSHGGRYQCPSSWPHMCSGINGRVDFCEDDHCCVASADMCSRPSVALCGAWNIYNGKNTSHIGTHI